MCSSGIQSGSAEAEDGVGLDDMEPVEREVEADDRVLGQPLDQAQRLADRPPPDLMKLIGPSSSAYCNSTIMLCKPHVSVSR